MSLFLSKPDAGAATFSASGDADFRYLPTQEEVEAVDWLKMELDKCRSVEFPDDYKEFVFSDTKLLRFLRGRKHDRGKALNGLIKHVHWRTEVGSTPINIEEIQPEAQKRKILDEGKDENGRPIVYLLAGRHDKADRDLVVMKKYIVYTIEKALASNKIDENTRWRDERLNIVFDLTFFGAKTMDYDFVKLLVDTLQFNFPDVLECAYVVNGPFLFNAFWSVLKPCLDPTTVKKICFCDVEQLHERFPGSVSSEFGEGPLSSPRPLQIPAASTRSFVASDPDTFMLPQSPKTARRYETPSSDDVSIETEES